MFRDKFDRSLYKILIDPSGASQLFRRNDPDYSVLMPVDRIVRFVSIMSRLGFEYVQLSEGEPFARPDIFDLIDKVTSLRGVKSFNITTNGIKLPENIEKLNSYKINSLSILLPALDSETYEIMTGDASFEKSRRGLESVTKLNTNVIAKIPVAKNVNHHQIEKLVNEALSRNLDIYVEEVKTEEVNGSSDFSMETMIDEFKDKFDLRQDANSWRVGESKQHISFTTLIEQACQSCQKLWLTASGRLVMCHVIQDSAVDLMAFFDSDPSDIDLLEFGSKAPLNKPMIGGSPCVEIEKKIMSRRL